MKKLQFFLLAAFGLALAASADLGVHLFRGLFSGYAAEFVQGMAGRLLSLCGIRTPEQFLAAFLVLLLITGALAAGNIVCAAGRAMQSKMAKDE